MIKLFRRTPVTRTGRQNRVVLRLEGLDGREAPSGGLVSGSNPGPAQDGQPPVNQAPQIVDFDAENVGNGWWLISGRVVDEQPDGLTVSFGGAVASLANVTVVTDADGEFSYLVQLNNNGTDTGWLSATTTDGQGAPSSPVYAYCDP